MCNPGWLIRRIMLTIVSVIYLGILGCSTTQTTAPIAPLLETPPPSLDHAPEVRTGLEVFLAGRWQEDSLKYGLLANQTSVTRDLQHSSGLLKEHINLALLLSPEHGMFGAENAGDQIGEERDQSTGIPIKTTYRQTPAEIAALIENLDVILFDIQDIGVRSYTYISSMAYLMKAAEIAGVKVIILDRPNPINGLTLEGNILDTTLTSFVGIYPIPYRHGMTVGELALLFNEEFGIGCDLEVVPMEGWQRDMYFDETELPWVPTSPHVPDAETILPMIATGTYGELGKLSEGVGITTPFEVAGGPWITNPHEYADALNTRGIAGVSFRAMFFKPYYGRHKGEVCGGVQLHVTDRDKFRPYLTGLQLLAVHQELYPEIDLFENEHRWSMFAKVMGSQQIRTDIQEGRDPLEMSQSWQVDLAQFGTLRQKYLLY